MYTLIVEICPKTLLIIKPNILKMTLLPKVPIFKIKEVPGDLTLYLVNV